MHEHACLRFHRRRIVYTSSLHWYFHRCWRDSVIKVHGAHCPRDVFSYYSSSTVTPYVGEDFSILHFNINIILND